MVSCTKECLFGSSPQSLSSSCAQQCNMGLCFVQSPWIVRLDWCGITYQWQNCEVWFDPHLCIQAAIISMWVEKQERVDNDPGGALHYRVEHHVQ